MKWLGIMLMAALLASAPGYGSAQQIKDTPPATQPQGPEVKGQLPGTAKSLIPAERQAYEKKTAEELDAIQQKIGEIRIKSATGASQNKRVIARTANILQMHQSAAVKELTVLQKASETAWGPQKAKLDKAMAELRQALGPNATEPK
jgi:hypothetical protein